MFCLKSLQLLLQRSNRLNCFEQCPCGTCQRHQGQDDVHDTGTHWPKDRQQVRYPWRKISGHWANGMASHWLTLAWMIMKYHECTYALWTLNTARGNLTDVRTPVLCRSSGRASTLQNFEKPRTSHPNLSKDWNPGTFQKPAKTNTLETLWNLPNENLQRLKPKPKTQIPRLEGKKTDKGKISETSA